jgi:hypothetical protein
MSRIFISYAREDRDSAVRLYNELRHAGLMPWIDVEDLIGGQDWRFAVKEAIRSSSYFLALVSKNSVSKRGYVQKELRDAMEVLQQLPPGQIYLVPVRLDESVPVHQVLADLHWIDLFSSYSQGLRRLLRSLVVDESETASPVNPGKQHSESVPPPEVLAIIQSRAEHDFPNDLSTRRYRHDTEIKAWRDLQVYSPQDIPMKVLQLISASAMADFTDDFSARLNRLETEVEAWRTLQRLSHPGVPPQIMEVIIDRAERDFPSDYSTQLYRINKEVEAWLTLQYDDGLRDA